MFLFPLPPQGETRKLEALSFYLPDRNGAGRSPEEHRKFEKRTDAPILRRLTAAPPFLWKGAKNCREAATTTLAPKARQTLEP